MTERKQDQGRYSRRTGRENETRILTKLRDSSGLTFTQLSDPKSEHYSGFSKPVLINHLKNLRKKGSIEKDFVNDQIIYRIKSDEKVRSEVKKDLFDLIIYLFSWNGLTKNIEKFLDDLVDEVMKSGKEGAYEEKILKPLERAHAQEASRRRQASERTGIVLKAPEKLYAFPESKIERLKAKYPKEMAELLKEEGLQQ